MPPYARASRKPPLACKECSRRKIWCSVPPSGPPCANCALGGVKCEVAQRRRRRTNSDILPGTFDGPGPIALPDNAAKTYETASSGVTSGPSHRPKKTVHWKSDISSTAPDASTRASADDSEKIKRQSSQVATNDISAYADTLEGDIKDEDRVPFYPGDRRGLAFVLDICKSSRPSDSNHFYAPKPSIEALLPEDINYLRAKGVFSLPPRYLQEELLRCYFHYSHPTAPIIDPADFIPKYEKGRVSLLLLWGIFLTAATTSCISPGKVEFDINISPLQQTPELISKQTLYDMEYERDKTTLIQATYLLSHWYSDTEDRTGPWHWNGIAISLSHTIGLHMLGIDSTSSREMQSLWRCIWWSIYCREVWLSLGQGRPVRIPFDDFDTPMPEEGDVAEVFSSYQADPPIKYIPGNLRDLSWAWICVLKVSKALGAILATSYRSSYSLPSVSETIHTELLLRSYLVDPELVDDSKTAACHYYQCKLYTLAVVAALYRPFLRDENRSHILPNSRKPLPSFAFEKARVAATEASEAANAILADGLTGLCQSLSVIAFVPVMQIHLLESTVPNPIQREAGKRNLAVCMAAMNKLRKWFVSAEAIYLLFEKAQLKIEQQAIINNDGGQDTGNLTMHSSFRDVAASDNPRHSYHRNLPISNTDILSRLWTPDIPTLGIEGVQSNSADIWLNIDGIKRESD